MTGIEYQPINSLLHPTDFSKAGELAFIHALKIALCNQSHFDILHVDSIDPTGSRWAKFPQVRQTLEHWKLLEEGSLKQAVGEELGLKVRKLDLPNKKPVPAMLEYFEREECDLIVLSTEGRSGLPRWLKPSISESLARSAGVSTLFVPENARGFVIRETGDLVLERVLIPVDHKPNPQGAIESAGGFLRSLGVKVPRLDVFHVGDTSTMPEVEPPSDEETTFERIARRGNPVDEIVKMAKEQSADLIVMATEGHNGFLDALRGSTMPEVEPPSDMETTFERIARRGNPVDEIVKMAKEQSADLIVMATEGHNGFLDALRGSTTEQALRQAPCPVLAVPPGTW